MATLAAILEGIECRLQTIDGLRVRPYVPAQIEPPMAVIAFTSASFHGAFQDGRRPFEFTVIVFVGSQNERSAQEAVLSYADTTGTKSIKAAIEADRTLGGLANTDAIVTDCDQFGMSNVGGYDYIGVQFTVQVQSR